jgi:hypothetical protein
MVRGGGETHLDAFVRALIEVRPNWDVLLYASRSGREISVPGVRTEYVNRSSWRRIGWDSATVDRHEAWQQAHHPHTYQRLVKQGRSHTETTRLVFALVTLCSVLASVSLLGSVPERVAADFGVAVLIAGYLVLPSLIQHRGSLPALGARTSRVDR